MLVLGAIIAAGVFLSENVSKYDAERPASQDPGA